MVGNRPYVTLYTVADKLECDSTQPQSVPNQFLPPAEQDGKC